MEATCALFDYRPQKTRNLDIFPIATREDFETALTDKVFITGTCIYCGCVENATTQIKKCSRCYSTSYCSRECQKADYSLHKLICKQIAETVRPLYVRGHHSAAIR